MKKKKKMMKKMMNKKMKKKPEDDEEEDDDEEEEEEDDDDEEEEAWRWRRIRQYVFLRAVGTLRHSLPKIKVCVFTEWILPTLLSLLSPLS